MILICSSSIKVSSNSSYNEPEQKARQILQPTVFFLFFYDPAMNMEWNDQPPVVGDAVARVRFS